MQKFARLAEVGNFTKAAKLLHISQPALSIAVDKLEHELGTSLLIRGNRKLELTEAGRAVYQSALEHQNISDHLRARLNYITHKRPAVTIGMTDSVAAVLCASSAFDELESNTDVTIVVNNSKYLRDAVEQRQLDLAYVVDDGAEHRNLFIKPAGLEELMLVCLPSLQGGAESDITEGRLYNLISYDKPSTTYRHIQQALQTRGIKPHVSLFSTSPDVMLTMVLRGKGVGVLPQFIVHDYVKQGILSYLRQNDAIMAIERPVCLVQPAGKSLPEYLRNFVAGAKIG